MLGDGTPEGGCRLGVDDEVVKEALEEIDPADEVAAALELHPDAKLVVGTMWTRPPGPGMQVSRGWR